MNTGEKLTEALVRISNSMPVEVDALLLRQVANALEQAERYVDNPAQLDALLTSSAGLGERLKTETFQMNIPSTCVWLNENRPEWVPYVLHFQGISGALTIVVFRIPAGVEFR